ncbi:MAG: lipocalin-like domain-containing protein, partial [Thermomicrobiales bacterium]
MRGSVIDELSRILASSSSRRTALRRTGGLGLAATGVAGFSRAGLAQEASPVAGTVPAGAQDVLDALDDDTRDSIARALWLTELRAEDIAPDILSKIIDPKNSNQAFGLRSGAHLLALIAEPSSFVQSYSERYETLLTYCASLSPHQAYILANLIGIESSKGYEAISSPANLQFPQANAIRLKSLLGWYFFVGSATTAAGDEYGIELMFFRYSLLPPDLAAALGLTDTENQVVELHFSVAKAGERHYQAKPIVVAGTTGLLSFESEGFGASMGKNVIRSTQPGSLFPMQLQAQGTDDGEQTPTTFEIDLTFSTGNDYLLQGADGCMPCCDGIGTHYYSIPGLKIDPAASTLTVDGEQVSLAEGTFWFDHQWGMLNALPNSEVIRAASNLSPIVPGGWDWFQAQFLDNQVITAFAMHSNDNLAFYYQTGTTKPGTMTVPVRAKYIDPAFSAFDVAGSLSITDWITSVDSPAPSMYPPTHVWYPNRWEFTFGQDVPEAVRVFTMTPIVATGQSGFFANGAQYSEGAVHLTDATGAVVGVGFAESTAYADTLSNQLRLVGIPATDDMLTLFRKNPPEPGMVLASQAFAALNAAELEEISGMCLGL